MYYLYILLTNPTTYSLVSQKVTSQLYYCNRLLPVILLLKLFPLYSVSHNNWRETFKTQTSCCDLNQFKILPQPSFPLLFHLYVHTYFIYSLSFLSIRISSLEVRKVSMQGRKGRRDRKISLNY